MNGTRMVLLLAFCIGCATDQTSDAIHKLEMRVTALEGTPVTKADTPRLTTGPAALRVASLRAAADDLERAELSRKSGDTGKAAALFQAAVDEVGADALVDVEPLFKNRTAVQKEAPPPPETPPAAPAAAVQPPAPEPPKPPPAHPRERDRASLTGAIRLEGPFAAEGGLGVVLLSPVGGGRVARPSHAAVEQRNKEFVPHVVTVPVGSTVSFPNTDPVFHNVFSLSPTKRFDLGLYKQGSKDVTFNKPGIVHVLCNLHASMSSYVVIHEEPYAAVTDRTGRFHFRDLPPGRYRVRVWHERAHDVATREVVVEGGATELFVPVRADAAHDLGTDKEGKPRGPQKHS